MEVSWRRFRLTRNEIQVRFKQKANDKKAAWETIQEAKEYKLNVEVAGFREYNVIVDPKKGSITPSFLLEVKRGREHIWDHCQGSVGIGAEISLGWNDRLTVHQPYINAEEFPFLEVRKGRRLAIGFRNIELPLPFI